ncbi:MAG: conjugated bile salt MFS transporter [Sarcina sp.]
MNKSSNKKFIGGWSIVVACMLIQAIPFGVAANIQPQFINYVVEGKGFSLAAFSLIFTLGTIVSAIASPLIGHAYSKFNAKLIFLIGCILSGGGFALFSLADSLWQFYLIAGVVQVGTAAISSIGVPLLINAWFSEEVKGKAMGLAFAGGSIGNIFLQQMVVRSLASQGFAKSYFIYGLLSLVVGIPVTLIALRMPKGKEEIVTSTKESTDKNKETNKAVDYSYTLTEVKKMKEFWIFAVGFVFVGMYVSALAVQYPAYLSNLFKTADSFKTIAPTFIGLVGSTFAFFSLGGNILGGFLFDKLGITKCLIVAFIFAAVSCTALLLAGSIPYLALLFAALKGLSVFAYMMGPSYLTGSFFGRKNFGAILGVVNLMFAVGFAAGSTVFGLIVDKAGYTAAWGSMLAFIFIAYSLLITTSIKMKKINDERKAKLAA